MSDDNNPYGRRPEPVENVGESLDRRPLLKGLGALGVASIVGSQAAVAEGDDSSFELREATVGDIHTAMKSGEVTAVSLVDQYLKRIDAYDHVLRSIITVNADARERARELDRQFESSGFAGPLHGVPIVLKDNQDTHDMPTTAGSKALADSVPPRDAFLVEALRDAGGIILAKANLHEFSYGVDTLSSMGGETRNAYSTDHRPSGSSGGTAAAIAANLGAIGTGTDTCSSNRSPPAFNNLVGLRPTVGLISRTGIVPLSETKDTAGPMTRTVADSARMMDVMVGYDPEDPVTATGVEHVPEAGYVSHLDPDGLEGARIGVVREFFGRQEEESAPKAAADTVTEIIDREIGEMKAAGAKIVDPIDVIETEFLAEARVTEHEFKRDFDRYLAELGDAAPYSSLEAVVDSSEVAPEVKERILDQGALDIDVEGLDENVDYLQRLQKQKVIREHTLQQMAEHDLDALLYPPSTVPPVPMSENQPFEELPCELAAHTGFPAIALPAGFTPDGLPVGLELLGRSFAEPKLFELAYSYEQHTQHRRPPTDFPPVNHAK